MLHIYKIDDWDLAVSNSADFFEKLEVDPQDNLYKNAIVWQFRPIKNAWLQNKRNNEHSSVFLRIK